MAANVNTLLSAPLVAQVVAGETIELNNATLFSRPKNADSAMAFLVMDATGGCKENIQQSVVLSTVHHMQVNFVGEWEIEIFSMSQISTLFSFLDCQSEQQDSQTNKPVEVPDSHSVIMHTERNLAVLVEDDGKTFMGLLLSGMLNPQEHQLKSLFYFARNIESYWVAHFLLSKVLNDIADSNAHNISNASKSYGVSESYFRKLCHHAFSWGPKKQLRLWRAAHSVLQVIEKDTSISTIAGNNGYASSSHFSSEIKSLFGMSPGDFKKLERLLYD